MIIFCPKNGLHCPICSTPCEAPAINAAALAGAQPPATAQQTILSAIINILTQRITIATGNDNLPEENTLTVQTQIPIR